MKKQIGLIYAGLAAAIIALDQYTKYRALQICMQRCFINEFLSFEIVFNRGISWGLLSSSSTVIFLMVSSLIALVTLVISWHAYDRLEAGKSIIGETFVVAGSIGNLIDRVHYQGVVDFIEFSYQGYSWPSFNIADSFIVVGVLLIIWEYRNE